MNNKVNGNDEERDTLGSESGANVVSRGISRRRALTLSASAAAVAAVAFPLLSESDSAVAATTLASLKKVFNLPNSSTSITLPSDAYDQVNLFTSVTFTNPFAAPTGGTLTVLPPSGTPIDGQLLIFRITSTIAQTYSWPSIFHTSRYVSLPPLTSGADPTTNGPLTDYFLFTWRSAGPWWDLVAYVAGLQ